MEIYAKGDRFEDFLVGTDRPPASRIDYVAVSPWEGPYPEDFLILPSSTGTLSGMIPPDIATCELCLADIGSRRGRYEGYWATSCVNCGPRYSIITGLPYDRERTSMEQFQYLPGVLTGTREKTLPAAAIMHRPSSANSVGPASCFSTGKAMR